MKIGLITIGQSLRGDVTQALQAVLGSTVQLIEKGALDGLERAEIEKLAPKAGDYVLVTRLRDGSSVKVARRLITPKIQACIKELEVMDVDLNVLLCTGEFPWLRSKKPLVMLGTLITSFTCRIRGGKIGVVVPEKAANAEKKWKRKDVSVLWRGRIPTATSKP